MEQLLALLGEEAFNQAMGDFAKDMQKEYGVSALPTNMSMSGLQDYATSQFNQNPLVNAYNTATNPNAQTNDYLSAGYKLAFSKGLLPFLGIQ